MCDPSGAGGILQCKVIARVWRYEHGRRGESGSIIFTGIYDARCKKIQSIAQPPTMRHQVFTPQAFRTRRKLAASTFFR